MLTVLEDELYFTDEDDPVHEVFYPSDPFRALPKRFMKTTEYLNRAVQGRYEMWFADGNLR